jgi:hypothetical protein
VFFRHGDRPSFKPIQNNSKKIIVLCILKFNYLPANGKTMERVCSQT